MGRNVKTQDILNKFSAEQVLAGDYSNMQEARKWASKFKTDSEVFDNVLNFDFSENNLKHKYPNKDSLSDIFGSIRRRFKELTGGNEFDSEDWADIEKDLREARENLDAFNKETNFEHLQDPKMQAIYAFLGRFDEITDTLEDLELNEALNINEERLNEMTMQTTVDVAITSMQQDMESVQKFGISADPNAISREELNAQIERIDKENEFLRDTEENLTGILNNDDNSPDEVLNKCKETFLLAKFALRAKMKFDHDERIHEISELQRDTDKRKEAASKAGLDEDEFLDNLAKEKAQLIKNSKLFTDEMSEVSAEILKTAGVDFNKAAELNKKLSDMQDSNRLRNADVNELSNYSAQAELKFNNLASESNNSHLEMASLLQRIKDRIDHNENMRGELLNARGRQTIFNKIKSDISDNITNLTESLESKPTDKRLDKLKNKLSNMYNEIDRGNSDGKHKDSEEFKNMREALKNAQENPSYDNLKALSDMSKKYLEEKTKGIHISFFADKVRNQRLQLANDLKRMADAGLERISDINSCTKNQESRKAEIDKLHDFMPKFLKHVMISPNARKEEMNLRFENDSKIFQDIQNCCKSEFEKRAQLVAKESKISASFKKLENNHTVSNSNPVKETDVRQAESKGGLGASQG